MGSLAVTVKNDSTHDFYITKDPNWDDQVLTFDGEPAESMYPLEQGSSVVVGITIDYNEMGVIFTSGANYDYDPGTWLYQLTIGPDPETGNQSVTDGGPMKDPTVKYTLSDQEPLSMTMEFVDVDA